MRTVYGVYERAAHLRTTCRAAPVRLLLFRGLRAHTVLVRCRWSRGYTERLSKEGVHQSLSQEDALVRILIQDAFNPASTSVICGGCGDGASSIEHSHSIAPSTGSKSGCLAQCEASSATDGSAVEVLVAESKKLRGATSRAAGVSPCPAVPASVRGNPETKEETVSPPHDAETVPALTDSRGRNALAEPFATIRWAGQREDMPHSLEWLCCACHTYNSLVESSAACRKCGASATASHRSAFPPMRHVAVMPTEWVCQRCSYTNRDASAPVQAKGKRASAAREQRKKFLCEQCSTPFGGVQNWVCPACHHVCPRAATQCSSCFADRPLSWVCPCCKPGIENSVFAVKCRGCGHERLQKHSNAVVRCAACREWNDVRWELCGSCMAPLESFALSRKEIRSSEEAALTRPPLLESTAVDNMSGELVPDSAGILHSQTVIKASALLAAAWAPEAAGGLRRDDGGPASVVQSPPAREDEERPRVAMRLPDNAWWCFTCNVMHRRNVTFCDICLQPRGVMQLRNKTELAAMRASSSLPSADAMQRNAGETASLKGAADLTIVPATAEGDWQCPYCRRLRSVTQHDCCGHRREVPHGYWLCDRCCSTNRVDRTVCLGCGERQERVRPWTCAECEGRNDADSAVCLQCGVPHTSSATAGRGAAASDGSDSSTSIACAVCSAPNHFEKTACYRCRARLRDVEWRCDACGHGHRTRNALRCEWCSAIRQFDLQEEVWLCELCSTPVFSGGELPVRTHCPRCNAQRAPTAAHYPCRWKCTCGLFNRSRVTECPECGARRRLESLDTIASCPRCFRDTPMDVHETCAYCRASLADCFMRWESSITLFVDTTEAAEVLDESEMEVASHEGDNGADSA
ncbi:hypothetical protein LSCM1_00143 [Leishmania martiniquensis]|uniref:RanBP2-type domain-containing protein n=1 Tax=Leishmania martiniquensis TaxID=1580590 RepID=A0A836GBF6_9TRYP|nr:hypothetical protein LSCM1_00143 [Leishmania martiniquensis]